MAFASKVGACAWRATGSTVAAVAMGWFTFILAMVVADAVATLIAGVGGGGFAGLIAVFALPFWIVGGVIVGVPAWLALHHSGVRSRRAATICGAALGGLAHPAAWIALSPGLVPDPEAVIGLAVLAIAGAVAGAMAGLAFRVSFYEHDGIR